jgi:hypothetical protein
MNGSQESLTCEDAPIVNPTISIGRKKCPRCQIKKQTSDYGKNKNRRNCIQGWCKHCTKEYHRKKRAEERMSRPVLIWKCRKCGSTEFTPRGACRPCKKRMDAVYQKQHPRTPEQMKESRDRYKKKNPEKVKAAYDNWRLASPDKAKAATIRWRAANKEKVTETRKVWRKNNPEYSKKIYEKQKENSDFRLNNCVRATIWRSLKRGAKKNQHWEDLVGYTLEKLRRHLEKQFTSEMSWENHGSHWHIDHIIPVKAFNFETPSDSDFKKCWALKNLRPLGALANISKGAKIDGTFQPSLLI